MQVRLEINVNGRPVCTTGCAGFGVQSVSVDWVLRDPEAYRPHPDDPDSTIEQWSERRLRLQAGGLDSAVANGRQHLHWENRHLEIGDEIVVRVLPPGEFDEPQTEAFAPEPPIESD